MIAKDAQPLLPIQAATSCPRRLETKEAMRKFIHSDPFSRPEREQQQQHKQQQQQQQQQNKKTLNFDPPLYMSSKIGPHLSVWESTQKENTLAIGDQNISSICIPS